jgi:hypothetical protein
MRHLVIAYGRLSRLQDPSLTLVEESLIALILELKEKNVGIEKAAGKSA